MGFRTLQIEGMASCVWGGKKAQTSSSLSRQDVVGDGDAAVGAQVIGSGGCIANKVGDGTAR